MFYQYYRCTLMILGLDIGRSVSWFSMTPGWWILGNNFLHNYYSIYDHSEMRVGLVPSKISKKAEITEAIDHEKLTAASSQTSDLLSVAAVGALAILGGAYLISKARKFRESREYKPVDGVSI